MNLKTTIIAVLMASGSPVLMAGVTAHDIIPRPAEVTTAKGTFDFGREPESVGKATTVKIDGKGSPESYTIRITPRAIKVTASDEAGAFYARQTLRQLTELAMADSTGSIACATIADRPRFSYRGLHFDVSRHFRTIDFLKKQIDAMARLKLNNLHLHFTDGAGWRMPIEKYPRLTSYAAWRPQLSWQDWRDNGATYCDEHDARAQGGYYTKEQLRDLVEYAAERHINVIPEIEMPGHSEEVIAAYPELSCNGTGSDLCPGKESTFEFLEDVLEETMEVFPSRLIHIGGDEAGKGAWRDCPDCQRRMKEEGLKSIDELQSYLIKRIERYVNSKGRSIIGWDEILQGGVAPNATVMSWRGTEGGIEALNSGHDVIMTPGAYCYIDYSQDAPWREPVSIGGYTPLAKTYSYEPLEPGISEDAAKHLKGVQANLWSEYVTTDSHAEHMYYPRAYAIAEIGWSPAGKDYADFRRRALAFNSQMQRDGYAAFDLANEYGDRPESLTEPVGHLARGAKVSYSLPYHSKYPGCGDSTLVDGLRGGWNNNDGRWQGTLTDVDLTIDLGRVMPVHYLDAAFMHSEGAWIHLPEEMSVELSTDGTSFRPAGVVKVDIDPSYPKTVIKNYGLALEGDARWVRVRAQRNPREGSWLFLDEIIVK